MHLPVLSVTKLENNFNSIFKKKKKNKTLTVLATICAELNVKLD